MLRRVCTSLVSASNAATTQRAVSAPTLAVVARAVSSSASPSSSPLTASATASSSSLSSLLPSSWTSASSASFSPAAHSTRRWFALSATPPPTEAGQIAPSPASVERDIDIVAEFHLATHDVQKAKTFYQYVLGCHHIQHVPKRQLIVNRFYNHKIVVHLAPRADVEAHASRMPFPAASLVFKGVEELEVLHDQVCKSGWHVLVGLRTRWGGQPHEQTFFRVEDPSNNLLEFSAFTHPEHRYTQPRL